jgi:hypothetical protein
MVVQIEIAFNVKLHAGTVLEQQLIASAALLEDIYTIHLALLIVQQLELDIIKQRR